MIRVKNGGTASIPVGGTLQDPKTADVFQGFIDVVTLPNKQVGYQILFTEKNQNWHEPIEVSPQVNGDPETGTEFKDAVYKHCDEPEFHRHGFFAYTPFDCDHEEPLLLRAHQKAIEVLNRTTGVEWEIFNLQTV